MFTMERFFYVSVKGTCTAITSLHYCMSQQMDYLVQVYVRRGAGKIYKSKLVQRLLQIWPRPLTIEESSVASLRVKNKQKCRNIRRHLKLPVLEGPLEAIQPFSLTSTDHWATLGNYFTSGFVCSQHTAPKNIKLAQTALLWYQFTLWSSGASEIYFLCPEKFALGQCRIRTRDLSICSRTLYHWTNALRQRKHLFFIP